MSPLHGSPVSILLERIEEPCKEDTWPLVNMSSEYRGTQRKAGMYHVIQVHDSREGDMFALTSSRQFDALGTWPQTPHADLTPRFQSHGG